MEETLRFKDLKRGEGMTDSWVFRKASVAGTECFRENSTRRVEKWGNHAGVCWPSLGTGIKQLEEWRCH